MMKTNGADAFERSLKEALDSYEVPYNSADWAQLEQKLDTGKSSNWQASAGLYALLLGGAVAVMTTVWYFMQTEDGSGMSEGIALVIEDQDEDRTSGAFDASEIVTATPVETDIITAEITGTISDPTEHHVAKSAISGGSTAKRSATRNDTPTSSTPVIGNSEPEADETASKTIAIKPSITEGCPGTTVEFDVENMPGDGIHLWNFGDGSFSNKPSPTHTFSKAGTFEVMLSHSSLGGGNIHNKPASDRIIIHEAPEAAFHFRKDEEDNTVPSVRFENRSIGGNKYTWDFGDGSISEV
ncbi:MAG: PKD domain-containing protein, partial [Bacteroidota bacterium]|nr:PKD domain-containing protein [Bacteroidota bacterium]